MRFATGWLIAVLLGCFVGASAVRADEQKIPLEKVPKAVMDAVKKKFPDVKITQVKTNHFQAALLQHYGFFNFAKHYVVNHHPGKSFEVDDAVVQEFRKFMDDEKIPYTEADLIENTNWVRSNIKSEIFVDVFGQEEGLKVRAETDPQVTKALELLPQAKQLAESARHVLAERSSAHALTQ